MRDHVESLTLIAITRIKETFIRFAEVGPIVIEDVFEYGDDRDIVVHYMSAAGSKFLAWMVSGDLMVQEVNKPRELFGYTWFGNLGKPWRMVRRDTGWDRVTNANRVFPAFAIVKWTSPNAGPKHDKRATGSTHQLACDPTKWLKVKRECAKFKDRWKAEFVIDPSAAAGAPVYYIRVIGSEADLDGLVYAESNGEFV